MPAAPLHAAIFDAISVPTILALPPFNYPYFESQATTKPLTLKEIDHHIAQAEAEFLNSKGQLITYTENGKDTRIRLFNGNESFTLEIQDIYMRGLQFTRAMLTIAEYEGLEISPQLLQNYLKHYTDVFNKIKGQPTPDNFAKARQATTNFLGLMSEELAQTRIKKNHAHAEENDPNKQKKIMEEAYSQAFKDLKKATELLNTIAPHEDALCTYVKNEDNSYQLEISERLTFSPTEALVGDSKPAWYQQNLKNHGEWFKKFMDYHFAEFSCASPPCTTRDLPNPANAWQETSCTLDATGKLLHSETDTRVAIVSPFQLKDKQARVTVAADNMQKLLSAEKLQETANRYIERWGPLLDGVNSIGIPILHQTLVAPTFFYGGDRNMIQVKGAAGQNIKLENQLINNKAIHFDLLQTNNCINIWHPLLNPRDHDIEDSNKLVDHAKILIARFQSKVKDKDIQQVIDFLANKKTSFLPIWPFSNKEPSKTQQQTIDKVCEALFKGGYPDSGLTLEQQKQLALTIEAAVNLKKLNHETILGFAKRKINNLFRFNGMAPLSIVTGTLASPAYLGRYLINTTSRAINHLRTSNPPSWKTVFLPTLNGYKNKHTFKSAYESILADNLGLIMGGCKSAYDRYGEKANNTKAQTRHFYKTGKLLDFDCKDKEYYDYLKNDLQPIEEQGHQNRVPATVDHIGARKLWESATHYWTQVLDAAQRKIIQGNAAKFRKPTKIPTGEAKTAVTKEYGQHLLSPIPPTTSPSAENFTTPSLTLTTQQPEAGAILQPAGNTRKGSVQLSTQHLQQPPSLAPLLNQSANTLEKVKSFLNQQGNAYHVTKVKEVGLGAYQTEQGLAVSLSPIEEGKAPTKFYAKQATEGVEFCMDKANLAHQSTATLAQICEIAVAMAEPGAVFDLSHAPKEKRAELHQHISEAIQKRFKDQPNRPTILETSQPASKNVEFKR